MLAACFCCFNIGEAPAPGMHLGPGKGRPVEKSIRFVWAFLGVECKASIAISFCGTVLLGMAVRTDGLGKAASPRQDHSFLYQPPYDVESRERRIARVVRVDRAARSGDHVPATGMAVCGKSVRD